jgi:uncharacterized protein (DUF342 family)
MELHIAGSESNPSTILALQADPETRVQLDKLERTIKFCDENMTKIMRTMGLRKLDPGAIKARVPLAKRTLYMKILEQLNVLVKKRRDSTNIADRLNKQMENNLRQIKIQVAQALFPRVEVQVGTRKLSVSQDLGPTVFCLKDNKIEMQDQGNNRGGDHT